MMNLFLALCGVGSALALLLLAARCLGVESLRAGTRRWPLQKPLSLAGEPFSAGDGAAALLWGAAALALAYLAAMLYCGIFREGVSWDAFWQSWRQYDAFHYLGLAEYGYGGYLEGGRPLFLVFFPLYPWLVRLLHLAVPSFPLCGLLVSGLSFLGGCVMFARLVTEELGRRTARLGLAFLCAYPFAFFFASMYTESLFLFLSVTAFYCIRRHKYPLAGLFGALAAMTRMQGVCLAAVAFVEYWLTDRPVEKLRRRAWGELWRDVWGKLVWMAAMGLGTAVYLALNYAVTGDPFRFLAYQSERWYQGSAFFLDSLAKLWRGFSAPSADYAFTAYTTWGPQLALFVVSLVVLLYSVRRLPPTWTAYFAVCIFLNYSLNNPLSCCRYMACAFPMPAALAVAGQGERRRPLALFLLAACALLQGIYLIAYFETKHVC